MNKNIAILIGAGLIAALLLFSMTYTVSYHEVAIRTRFGRTSSESVEREPGLKFRLPLFADKVTAIDTRLQVRESIMENIQTADGRPVVVRAFLLWKVDKDSPDGPLKFFRKYASVEEANNSLLDPLRTAVRAGVSRYAFNDLLGSTGKLGEVQDWIRRQMADLVGGDGIIPETVGISQMVLPAATTNAVLARMKATTETISESERYRGESEATGVQSYAATQSDKILNFAKQRAEEIKAGGERDVAKYIEQMAVEPSLAIFLIQRDALEKSLSEQTTMVLPAWLEPFQMLLPNPQLDSHGIPVSAKPAPAAPLKPDAPSGGPLAGSGSAAGAGAAPGKGS